MKKEYKPVHVIACGVLRLDIPAAAETTGIEISDEYLEGGLHAVPNELRRRLQEAIDRATASGKVDVIIVGYGLCGRGIVGIRAGDVPLVVPKIHDCIALFLGSDQSYRKEFAEQPGTYYISAGWYEEKVQPQKQSKKAPDSKDEELRHKDISYFAKKYGEENAHAIVTFYNSWKKNYKRSAFIDTGVGNRDLYDSYAEDLATEFGWSYKKIAGTHRLLQKLFEGRKDDPEILWVPPGYVIEFDARHKTAFAVPQWKSRKSEGVEEADNRERSGSGDVKSRRDRHTAGPKQRIEGAKGSLKTGYKKEGQAPIPFRPGSSRRIGLGIDAGGTYTDVAVYDFQSGLVLSKGKALTTKWDFTIGIAEAIDQLDRQHLSSLDLVSVSTTLATNAIVEKQGQKVGLLLMPSGLFDSERIEHELFSVIKGKLSIIGQELEPVDPEEIKRAASEMRDRHGINVFAVSGYGGSINPVHELQVKELIIRETGCYVCCGHELSDLLNFYVRANTAVLNARIIPLLEQFIQDVERSLKQRHIDVPIMMVKGDGTLMSTDLARYRPIETILSGPAASIAGARFLTGIEHATVIDIGGTTSDIGYIQGGAVEVCPQGASVGGWRTHVKALNMSTVGLGGDSEIQMEEQEIKIGPRRVAPLSWLAWKRNIEKAVGYVERNIDYFLATTRPLQFLFLTDSAKSADLSREERRIVEALEEGPCSVLELTTRTGIGHWLMLHPETLENRYLVQRCGLTPTDLLHVLGRMDLWNRDIAERMTDLVAARVGMERGQFIEYVFDLINRKVSTELFKKQMNIDLSEEDLTTSKPWQAVIHNLLGGGNGRMVLKAHFEAPVIGLGAPVHFFLEHVPQTLGCEILVPENADVANAIGAITSSVTVSKKVSIVPTVEGAFAIHGLPMHMRFDTFDEASDYAIQQVKEEVFRMARSAGTSEEEIDLRVDDRITKAADGTELFLERTVEALISGIPDLV